MTQNKGVRALLLVWRAPHARNQGDGALKCEAKAKQRALTPFLGGCYELG